MDAPAGDQKARQWDHNADIQNKIISIVLQTLYFYKPNLTPLDIVIAILKTSGKYEQVKRAMLKPRNIARFFDAVESCDVGRSVSCHGPVVGVVLRRVDAETRAIVSRLRGGGSMHPILLGHAEIRSEKSSAPLLKAIVQQANESMVIAQEDVGANEEPRQEQSWSDSVALTEEESELERMEERSTDPLTLETFAGQRIAEKDAIYRDNQRDQACPDGRPITAASEEDNSEKSDRKEKGVEGVDASSQEWHHHDLGMMDVFVKRLMGAGGSPTKEDSSPTMPGGPSTSGPRTLGRHLVIAEEDSGEGAGCGSVKEGNCEKPSLKRKLDEIETSSESPSVSAATKSKLCATGSVLPRLVPYKTDSIPPRELLTGSLGATFAKAELWSTLASGLVPTSDFSGPISGPFLAPLFPTVAESLSFRDRPIESLELTPYNARSTSNDNTNASAEQRAIERQSILDFQREAPLRKGDLDSAASREKNRPFACEHCPKRYVVARNLRDHMKLHTGQIPYKCSVDGCGKTFVYGGSFRRHEKAHLAATATKLPAEMSGDAPTMVNGAFASSSSCPLETYPVAGPSAITNAVGDTKPHTERVRTTKTDTRPKRRVNKGKRKSKEFVSTDGEDCRKFSKLPHCPNSPRNSGTPAVPSPVPKSPTNSMPGANGDAPVVSPSTRSRHPLPSELISDFSSDYFGIHDHDRNEPMRIPTPPSLPDILTPTLAAGGTS